MCGGAGEPTTTGLAVKALQDALPKARVLYSSATGASEPNNLGYMTRLGTFGYSGMVHMVQNLNKCALPGPDPSLPRPADAAIPVVHIRVGQLAHGAGARAAVCCRPFWVAVETCKLDVSAQRPTWRD